MARKRAFTLIELLVVIAIISLLVSIVLPSLNQARDIAKEVACQSQLHAMAVGMAMYAQEYDGSFVWTDHAKYKVYWLKILRPFIGVDNTDHPVPMYICPSDDTKGGIGKYGGYPGIAYYYPHLRSYTYNQQTHTSKKDSIGDWYNHPLSFSDPSSPASFAIMADHAWWKSNSVWFNPINPLSLESFGDWHIREGVNSMFADGHIESIPMEELLIGGKCEHCLYITNTIPQTP